MSAVMNGEMSELIYRTQHISSKMHFNVKKRRFISCVILSHLYCLCIAFDEVRNNCTKRQPRRTPFYIALFLTSKPP